jgi:hypothetical protein
LNPDRAPQLKRSVMRFPQLSNVVNMIRKSSLVIFFIIFGLAPQGMSGTSRQSEVSSEEYAVYSAVLGQRDVSEETTQFVIEDHTQPTNFLYDDDLPGHLKFVKRRLPSLSQVAFNDFRTKNQLSQPLNRSFNLKSRYSLLSRSKFEGFAGPEGMMEMSEVGWQRFYSEYGGASGLLSFSRVGFDHKRNQGLVFISHIRGHSSGRQWGDGSYVLLIKKKGRWRVQGRVAVMVS